MAYSATTINSELGKQLFDTDESIWTAAIKSSFVNEAQHLIVSLRPDASVTTTTLTLDTTSKQSIPSGGVMLLDVPANTSGVPVQKIEKDRLTKLVPAWTTETGTALEFFMFDPENPTVFWVYPKPASAFSVDIIYSAEPAEFTTSSTALGISDIYITAIYEWAFFRCYSMQTKGVQSVDAQIHLKNFYTLLGIKKDNDILLQQTQAV